MSSTPVRRGAVLGLMVSLLGATAVVADTVVTDGDAISPGNQTSVNLGDVAPGATVALDVAFRLTCKGLSHVAEGSTITVALDSQTWPADGTATVSAGSITVPAGWPAPGDGCPDLNLPTTLGATPAHLVLTAPTAVGTGYGYDFLFASAPADGITNTTAFSATLNVVEPPAVDAVPPVLEGMPADITVTTAESGAAVAWAMPTATDDVDPAPAVACSPPSGSTFALGTWPVTCTATDASGNQAAAAFNVTVRQVTVRHLAATWGRPLGDGIPALVGQLGRTIPLKLSITADGSLQGPRQIEAPVLALERLDGCATDAQVLESRAGGTFAWDDGAWRLNLGTRSLAAGCWRLAASVHGSALAVAIVRLVPDVGDRGARRAGGRRAR